MTLKELKSGDTVIIHGGGYGRRESVDKVDHVTHTKIVVKGMGFRIDSGFAKGNSFGPRARISIPREGDLERISIKNKTTFLANKFRSQDWGSITLEKLRRIDAILSEPCASVTP